MEIDFAQVLTQTIRAERVGPPHDGRRAADGPRARRAARARLSDADVEGHARSHLQHPEQRPAQAPRDRLAGRLLVLDARRTAASGSTPTCSAASVGAAFRLVPEEIKTIEQLGLPNVLHDFVKKPRGFVLVTGPDRLRQVDVAGGDDRRDQRDPARPHPHDRGPDRVPAPPQEVRREPARDRRRRAELRARPQGRPAPGPRRDPRGRDARPRDDPDRADRGRDRTPRVRHASHAGHGVHDRPHHRRLPPPSSSR